MKQSRSNEITLLKLRPDDQQRAICALLREYVPRLIARTGCDFIGFWCSLPYPLYCSKLRIGELVIQINFELPTASGEVRLWRSSALRGAHGSGSCGTPEFLSSVLSSLGLRGSPFGVLERREGEASEIYIVRHDLENLLLLYSSMTASPKFPDVLPIYNDHAYMADMRPIHCPDLPCTP